MLVDLGQLFEFLAAGIWQRLADATRLLQQLIKTDLLILDDWGLAPMGDRERRDLLEIIEDRTGRRATLITSQVPIEHWHDSIGDATFGDAILDRLVHHAHRIVLTGGSMRKLLAPAAAAPLQSPSE